MKKLLIVALLLTGCAVGRSKFAVPGCPYRIPPPAECDDSRSYKKFFPDRVEYHCIKDMYYEGKVRTQEQVLTYRCVHVHIQGDEKK